MAESDVMRISSDSPDFLLDSNHVEPEEERSSDNQPNCATYYVKHNTATPTSNENIKELVTRADELVKEPNGQFAIFQCSRDASDEDDFSNVSEDMSCDESEANLSSLSSSSSNSQDATLTGNLLPVEPIRKKKRRRKIMEAKQSTPVKKQNQESDNISEAELSDFWDQVNLFHCSLSTLKCEMWSSGGDPSS